MSDVITDVIVIVLVAAMFVAIVAGCGVLGIWALNTLFGLEIVYTAKTVLAFIFLWMVITPSKAKIKVKD